MLSNLTDLDIRLIRIFLAVVDAGGLTPAQSTLNMGQPTISTQLAVLESRLGFKLCSRGRAGFKLSAKGERFLQLSTKLLANFNDFSAQARNMNKQLVGSIHIGLIGHISKDQNALISSAIARFRQRSQIVQFTISVLSPNELEARLLTGDIQLAIGYFWHRAPSLEYTQLFVEHQVAYCGLGHPLFKQAGFVTENSAESHEWAWRSYRLNTAQQSTRPSKVTAVADNMEAMAILVLSGCHLGYLPTHFAAPYVARGLLAALNPALLKYDVIFHLVTRDQHHRNEILNALIEDMRAVHLFDD